MSSPEGIQDFNKTLLNIRKYAVGKEKEELLTLGRSFADINTLDDNHRRSRSEKKASTRSSGGSQLNSSSSDLRDIEQLYLDEVRTNSGI